MHSHDSDTATGRSQSFRLAPHLVPSQTSYLRFGPSFAGAGFGSSQNSIFFGLDAMYRWESLGPNLALLMRPSSSGYESVRVLGMLGIRSYIDAGFSEVSYGVVLDWDARLEDHFWILHASPIELGVVLYETDSRRVELQFGIRKALTGELINHFLIDPNGFDNEDAADTLDERLVQQPYSGFLRLVIGRKLD